MFSDEKERVSLPVREHSTDGFFLEGMKLIECKDYHIACSALDLAVKNRQVGSHDLNNRSSRSHCITDIFIEVIKSSGSDTAPARTSTDYDNNMTLGDIMHNNYHDSLSVNQVIRGKLSLIDLAGSERLKNTNRSVDVPTPSESLLIEECLS